jgi:hypothetical protein
MHASGQSQFSRNFLTVLFSAELAYGINGWVFGFMNVGRPHDNFRHYKAAA